MSKRTWKTQGTYTEEAIKAYPSIRIKKLTSQLKLKVLNSIKLTV